MAEELVSVGLDVGTTSTQLVISRLTLVNQNSTFSVPKMTILHRKVVYKSPVFFTPLVGENLVDGDAVRRIVTQQYEKAGIRKENVDTGAVIITGETSRKENAKTVLSTLSGFAGDFVVATAGPDLESILAAKGAAADRFSSETGKTVIHIDIGGGTSNLALIRDGKIVETGCLNVGGRLIKLDKRGEIQYISPVLQGICHLKVGQTVSEADILPVAGLLTRALETAAGKGQDVLLLDRLRTSESSNHLLGRVPEDAVVSFSGGVADCIETRHSWLEFGDIGPVLGQCIRRSLLCRDEYRLGEETIRATVIGAGSHSLQLSGSTVFCRNVPLPLKNLPVAAVSRDSQTNPDALRSRLATFDTEAILYLPGREAPDYAWVRTLSRAIATAFGPDRPVLVAVGCDMAKALGQTIALQTDQAVLCLDGLELEEGSYLDVGEPVGPAMPVVVKTLILER